MTAKIILIVDDDHDFVEAVSAFLEANGYLVLKAYDGREGLKLARLQRPDLILMDVLMGERTEGFFTVHEIRRAPQLSGIPIFVVTSMYSEVADFRIAPAAAWLAHDEFFAKPVDLPALLERIRERLGENKPAVEPAGRKAEP